MITHHSCIEIKSIYYYCYSVQNSEQFERIWIKSIYEVSSQGGDKVGDRNENWKKTFWRDDVPLRNFGTFPLCFCIIFKMDLGQVGIEKNIQIRFFSGFMEMLLRGVWYFEGNEDENGDGKVLNGTEHYFGWF